MEPISTTLLIVLAVYLFGRLYYAERDSRAKSEYIGNLHRAHTRTRQGILEQNFKNAKRF